MLDITSPISEWRKVPLSPDSIYEWADFRANQEPLDRNVINYRNDLWRHLGPEAGGDIYGYLADDIDSSSIISDEWSHANEPLGHNLDSSIAFDIYRASKQGMTAPAELAPLFSTLEAEADAERNRKKSNLHRLFHGALAISRNNPQWKRTDAIRKVEGNPDRWPDGVKTAHIRWVQANLENDAVEREQEDFWESVAALATVIAEEVNRQVKGLDQ